MGSTYVAMRVGVRDLPPLVMSGARFLSAGVLLYAWCALRRRRTNWKRPTAAEWRSSVILGLALPALGTGGATWAEQKLPAGTAALLLATIPLWIILAGRIVDHRRIGILAAAGLVLGLLGVAVLVDPFSAPGQRTCQPAPSLSPERCPGASARSMTDVGAGLGPRRGDLDPHPGHGDRAVTLPGCTSSWPPPAWTRWTRRPASSGQQAGQPPRIQAPGRIPD
jgi:drug/metabolite transporter (DMT)-like permease